MYIMSRTCKRVVYKKVKRSCKNALVGGSFVNASDSASDNDAVKAFKDAIAKLIPDKEKQNKIDATMYYKPIIIDHNLFNENICLYAFIILYCAVVHNFKIEPSPKNKALIDKKILRLLTDVLSTKQRLDRADVTQISKSLNNNRFGDLIIIDYLAIEVMIDFNTKRGEQFGHYTDNMITYAYLNDNNAPDDIKKKFNEVNMNQQNKDLDTYVNSHTKYAYAYLNNNFIISKIKINIPKQWQSPE